MIEHQELIDALYDAEQDVEMASLLLHQSKSRRDRAEERLADARVESRIGARK